MGKGTNGSTMQDTMLNLLNGTLLLASVQWSSPVQNVWLDGYENEDGDDLAKMRRLKKLETRQTVKLCLA